jgi:N-acetylmuramoyl-L-alanine amidase
MGEVGGLYRGRHKRATLRLRRWVIPVLVLSVIAILGWWMWSHRRPSFPIGIAIHHSASPMSSRGHLIGVEDIDRWHASRGFLTNYKGKIYHVGYHYVIRADGRVQPGLPEACRGKHATNGNDRIGICIVGDFSSKDNPRGKKGPLTPTPEQMRSLEMLCRRIMEKHHLGVETIRTHRQLDGDTECPGNHFPFETLIRNLDKHNNEPRMNRDTR